MDEAPPISEEIVSALVVRLLQKGLIDQDDIEAMQREVGDEAGHLLNALLIESVATPQSEWAADRARARFRVIEGGEE